MKINILILLCLLAGTFFWTYVSNNDAPPKQNSHVGKVQDFTFIALDGQKKNLYALEGHTILIHFWATWCAPCVKELPQLIELATNNPEIYIVAAAVNDTNNQVQTFLDKTSQPLPNNFMVALDPDKTISKDIFGTIKLPETYILKPDLTLFEKITGAQENWNRNY